VDDRLKMDLEILLSDDRLQQRFCVLVHEAGCALFGGVCLKALRCNDFFYRAPTPEKEFVSASCYSFVSNPFFFGLKQGLRPSGPETRIPKRVVR
jgi:hypothetical protein